MEAPLSITGASQRATCWSITINNPLESETKVELPSGWKLLGQFEEGKEGTRHFQGMVTTPQCRFAAVKKLFPRAHIEVARNKAALLNYVNKDDTRVGEFTTRTSDIPTLWDYQRTIAARWDDDEWEEFSANHHAPEDAALDYVDNLVRVDILAGVRGVEFIAINPMWRSSWKKFYKCIVKRERAFIPEQNVDDESIEDASQVQAIHQASPTPDAQNASSESPREQ